MAEWHYAALSAELKEFSGFSRASFLLTYDTKAAASGNPMDIVLDYPRIVFHLDLIKFSLMLHTVRDKADHIDMAMTVVGSIDALISIASYRRSLPFFAVPVFEEDAAAFYIAEDICHPLLSSPVSNSITADTPILLTGSNASGKSTFLKSAALAALMAQTILTVCAASYKAPKYRIFSSMALRDSLESGESYFIVEIRSLKRILDASAADGERPVLCCFDEVLRGTNTIERIAASSLAI